MTSVNVGGITVNSKTYDLAGNILTDADGKGNVTTYLYNNAGQVRQATFPFTQMAVTVRLADTYTNMIR